MAVEITKVHPGNLPKLRFIGKRCMCNPEGFTAAWSEWLDNGLFDQLETLGTAPENGDAYLGMTSDCGSRYWIGLLFPPGTCVPDGFEHMDIPASLYIVFELAGKKEGELLSEDGAAICFNEMDRRGLVHASDGSDFERYSRPVVEGKGKTLFECLFAID